MCISRLPPKTLLAWFCTEDIKICLNLLKQRGLVICSCLNSLKARRTFSGASTCPGVTSPLPPDALRTCNLFLPELTRGWGGLSLVPQLCPGIISPLPPDALRTSNLFSPTLAHDEEDFLISYRLHSLTTRRTFYSLLAYTHSRQGWLFNLFSPTLAHGEEDFLISSRLHSLTATRTKNFILVPLIARWRWGLKTLCFKTLYWMHAIWICPKLHKDDKVSFQKLKKRWACKLGKLW